MTELQKDTMLANILEQVQSQITYLVEQDLIEESLALYKEWEEHFDESIRQLEIITIIDLTTIWHIVTDKEEGVCLIYKRKWLCNVTDNTQIKTWLDYRQGTGYPLLFYV